jgi:hypothetical protein
MPFYYYTDSDGDQTALPCTERMLSSKMAELVGKHRFIPMLSMKGRTEVRLGGFGSLNGGPLSGSWQPVTASSASPAEPAAAAEEEAAEPEKVEEEAIEPAAETAEATEPAADTTEPAAETPAADAELDTLLAGLNEETAPATPAADAAPEAEAEPEVDPELAKLLKELG